MKIGAYDVIRVLGKGGMSEVYEAENPRLGSRHVLKVYTYRNDDPGVRRRFDVEGRLLARLEEKCAREKTRGHRARHVARAPTMWKEEDEPWPQRRRND